MAVIFRQRWEGFQVLAKHLKTRDQAIATQMRSEGRAPCGGHRRCSWARGGLGTAPGAGGIHQLIQQLGPEPSPRSLAAAFADRALVGSWNPASRDPSPSGRALSANGHVERNFEYVLVWRFRNSRGEATSGFAEQTDRLAATQQEFTSWTLWASDAAVNVLPAPRRSRQ